jgi:hypothetical protein
MIFGYPDKLVTVNGLGEFPCQDWYDGGAQGFFSSAQCKTIQSSVAVPCGCKNKNSASPPAPTPTVQVFNTPPVTAPSKCGAVGATCFNANDCCSNRCVAVTTSQRSCANKSSGGNADKVSQKLGGCRGGSGGKC